MKIELKRKCFTHCGGFFIPYVDIKSIPLDDYKELHREYWKANAKANTDFLKLRIYSSITGEELFIEHSCFACEYAERIRRSINSKTYPHYTHLCKFCPIKDWRYDDDNAQYYFYGCESMTSSWYYKYQEFRNKTYALKIAEMEWEDLHKDEDDLQ